MISQLEEQLNTVFKSEPLIVLECNVYKKDVLTMREYEWVSSESIHLLMNIIRQKYELNVMCMDPFIVSMILFMGEQDVILESMREKELFNFDYLLIPSNTQTNNAGKGSHWFLMCYQHKAKTIFTLDSSYQCIHKNAITMKNRLERMHSMFMNSDIQIKVQRLTTITKQNNDYDCGIFTVGHAEQLLKGIDEGTQVPQFKSDGTFFNNLRARYYFMMISKIKAQIPQ